MSMKKWKWVEDTLRSEGLKFGFSQMMGAVSAGEITCVKQDGSLWLDIDQARDWAVRHNAAKDAKRKKTKPQQAELFDSAEQLRRIADTLDRIEKLLAKT